LTTTVSAIHTSFSVPLLGTSCRLSPSLTLEMRAAASQFTLEKALEGIHYFRCHDYLELVALVNLLPEFLTQHPKVHLYGKSMYDVMGSILCVSTLKAGSFDFHPLSH